MDVCAAARGAGAAPMVLSVESCGSPSGCGPGMRGTGADMWRTTPDLQMYWSSVVSNFIGNAAMAPISAPGAINDPDMLVVGHPALTPDESRSHVALWTISAAPLLLSFNLGAPGALDADMLALIGNPEVIAIDQDAAVIQGTRASPTNATGVECWARRLAGSGTNATATAYAALLINWGPGPASGACSWAGMGIAGGAGVEAAVRDVWGRSDLGAFVGGWGTELASHASALIRVLVPAAAEVAM
jgi:alpha-galactosidase